MPLQSYDSLVSEIIHVHKTGNHSSLLALLREVAVYCSPLFRESLNESICNILLKLSRISSSSTDYDRKISRLCLYILTEIINYNTNDNNIAYVKNIQNKMFILIKEELELNNSSCNRLFTLWKTFGMITCNIKNIDDTNVSSMPASAYMATEVMLLAVNELKKLKALPIRKKKILLGQKKADKDYDNENLLWISVLSCMRHTNMSPPEDIINVLLIAITSPNEILARHALYLLYRVSCNTEFKASLAGSLLIKLRPQQGVDNVHINQQDDLCRYYLGNILTSLVLSDKLSELMIVDVYTEIKVFMINSTPKSCSDLILNLFKNRNVWFHISILENHKNGYKLIEEFCKILFKHISMTNITNMILLKLLQSCQCLGNFIWSSNFEIISSSSKYKPRLNNSAIEVISKLINLLQNTFMKLMKDKILEMSSSNVCKNIIITLFWLLPDEKYYNSFMEWNWIDLQSMIYDYLSKIDDPIDVSYDLVLQVFERLKYSSKFSIDNNNNNNSDNVVKVCDLLVIKNCFHVIDRISITYCSLKHISILSNLWNYFIVTFVQSRNGLLSNKVNIEEQHLQQNMILLDSFINILENSSDSLNNASVMNIYTLRNEALWMIGEYGLIWYDLFDNVGDIVLISQILPKILNELIFYSSANNLVAIKCLHKLHIRSHQILETFNKDRNINDCETIKFLLKCDETIVEELHKCNCSVNNIDNYRLYLQDINNYHTINSDCYKNNDKTPIKKPSGSITSDSSSTTKTSKSKLVLTAINALNISSADKSSTTRSSASKTLPSAKPAPITKKI